MSKKSNDPDLNKHRLHEDGSAEPSPHSSESQDKNSSGASSEAPNNVQKMTPDELGADHWRTEAEKFKNEYLYLMAEFENYKRNVIKERSDLRKYGSERLVVEILNGLDLLDKALESNVNADTLASFRKGIELTSTHFKTMLQKFGVEELPAKGVAFDPNIHEALSSEESRDIPAGHISQVFRKPYKLHERVVRPGQVVVARAPSESKSE